MLNFFCFSGWKSEEKKKEKGKEKNISLSAHTRVLSIDKLGWFGPGGVEHSCNMPLRPSMTLVRHVPP